MQQNNCSPYPGLVPGPILSPLSSLSTLQPCWPLGFSSLKTLCLECSTTPASPAKLPSVNSDQLQRLLSKEDPSGLGKAAQLSPLFRAFLLPAEALIIIAMS